MTLISYWPRVWTYGGIAHAMELTASSYAAAKAALQPCEASIAPIPVSTRPPAPSSVP